jgi:copper transporter 1
LFQRAVPESTGDYVLALFLIFFFAMLYEGYQVIYVRAIDWADNLSTAKSASSHTPSLSNKALAALIRASARIVGAGWSYLLMLITMTFNVGLFMAVIVGLGAGSAIFGPFHSKYSSLRVAEIQSSELCC